VHRQVGVTDYSGDGQCDDGGPGSDWGACEYGSDCEDCGARSAKVRLWFIYFYAHLYKYIHTYIHIPTGARVNTDPTLKITARRRVRRCVHCLYIRMYTYIHTPPYIYRLGRNMV